MCRVRLQKRWVVLHGFCGEIFVLCISWFQVVTGKKGEKGEKGKSYGKGFDDGYGKGKGKGKAQEYSSSVDLCAIRLNR